MGHHEQTLRTVVHHHRADRDPGTDSDSVGSLTDDDEDIDSRFEAKDKAKWYRDKKSNPLKGLGLDFLGLCCQPTKLLVLLGIISSPNQLTLEQNYLKLSSLNHSLRILHIRQPGPDVGVNGNRAIEKPDRTDSESDTESGTESNT